eukprot:TRINITY_DN206_c0_g4_i1.p1 TRINITY_DN206_c0_g4~~TRINITY_DN206_c0_g4_i1.p1  ORF type:complete len:561 (+),score=166.10 TRINITY_DN206_c0_g4_i1:79-1761(+)
MAFGNFASQVALLLVCFSDLVRLTAGQQGQRFLGTRERHAGPLAARGPADLLAELERLEHVADFDHQQKIESKLEKLETAMLPLFKIAPKDASGNVDSKAARYILHRHFSQKHGWFVNGIELHGGVDNSSRVGEALQRGKHFNIQQLARFAATLETLVHAENIARLQKAFNVVGFTKDQPMNNARAKKVIVTYMMFFISVTTPSDATYEEAKNYAEMIPSWSETKSFATAVQREVADEHSEVFESGTLWDFALLVVEELGERYGQWQNKDCVDLKKQLMEIELPGTARVPLSRFWGPVANGKQGWVFGESLPYLEQLGAVEGSEAPNHSVVIPNYLYSAGNCLASSKYYDVCCLNECDEILAKIESSVEAPDAQPTQLIELLKTISSSTVTAPRDLPDTLVQRLNDISAYHGGKVPLHGRLFFQLMHHAFPHECRYPIASLSQAVERNDEWISRNSDYSRVTAEAALEYSAQAEAQGEDHVGAGTEIPWSDEEDLFMQSMWLDASSAGEGGAFLEASLVVPSLALVLVLFALVLKLHRRLALLLGFGGKSIPPRASAEWM